MNPTHKPFKDPPRLQLVHTHQHTFKRNQNGSHPLSPQLRTTGKAKIIPDNIIMSLPLSSSKVDEEVQIRLGKSGRSAATPKTVFQNFDEIVKQAGSKPALYQKKPTKVRQYTVFLLNKPMLKLGVVSHSTSCNL